MAPASNASNATTTSSSANTTTTTSNNHAKKTNETTLTHLTKRFVKLLNSSERIINLNEASSKLGVAKRRIYDITNVLEGVGLLQKTSKNLTRWIDCPKESPFANSTQPQQQQQQHIGADAELLALLKTYQSLEEGVNDLESSIRQQLSAEGAYVTYHDIKQFYSDQIVIAVKAPADTRLEVNESLQIWMKSENGEIEVYLCPQYSQNNTNTNNQNNTSNNNNPTQQQQLQSQQPQLQNGYQTNTSPHLQQSQLSNSSNTQPLDATITNTNNLIGQQQIFTAVSSDEGRGRSTFSTTTDVQYYDPTSGVSNDDHYYNDPTLSSALSGTISEDEDPFKPLVPFEAREETHYNFGLENDYTITSLFPEDNLGLY